MEKSCETAHDAGKLTMTTKRLALSPDQLYDTLQTLVELNRLNLRLFGMDGMQEELSACEALLEFQQLLLDTCFENVH